MSTDDLHAFDLHDEDLRRRFDALAARADMPVVDPLADVRRAREARRRNRVVKTGVGLVAAAAVSALVLGNLADGDVDAGQHIANDPTPSETATTKWDLPGVLSQGTPDAETFGDQVRRLLDRPDDDRTMVDASYVLGETSAVSYRTQWDTGDFVVVTAGVSREAVRWDGFTDVTSHPLGNGEGVGERGTSAGGEIRGYVFDQPDGDVVVVQLAARGEPSLSADLIDTLLTELDVPASTLTAAEAWANTLQVMGIDGLNGHDLMTRAPMALSDVPSMHGRVFQGDRRSRFETGRVQWHAQALSADTPDCPSAFTDCRTMQIEGEAFLAKTVAGGEREGWLYLERDHGDVRAQVVLEPYEDGWSVPVEAAAELLLDGRWSSFAPESSVPYPEG
ncbi:MULTISPECIES: hypothetical protein [Nocardioides]|uniref:hypothetical protein n=1 Tax=Nocardioides TaxID=1839 RepID=UPI00032F12EE|nr:MULTISPECIES: hypothetical protein [Nocardioides]EON24666.1 cytochrome subunit of sulfide dehydrogenase [Nocardioides sp. CF8]